MRGWPGRRGQQGFTLVELMVGVAVVAILLALAAPSFKQLIAEERVKSVNAELVTAISNSRAEAVARNTSVQMQFQTSASMTCYIVFINLGSSDCDCTRTPGNACTAGYGIEIRTTQIPTSTDVQVLQISPAPSPTSLLSISVDGVQSGPTPSNFVFQTSRISGAPGKLQTTVNSMGRPTVCSPDNSVPGVAAC